MPKKREVEPLVKVTLNLYRSDYEKMHTLYASTGAAVAIRALLRQHVQRVETRVAQIPTERLVAEIDIGDDDECDS
jgi:hypothetical protein